MGMEPAKKQIPGTLAMSIERIAAYHDWSINCHSQRGTASTTSRRCACLLYPPHCQHQSFLFTYPPDCVSSASHTCTTGNRRQCLYPEGSGGSGELEIFWQAQVGCRPPVWNLMLPDSELVPTLSLTRECTNYKRPTHWRLTISNPLALKMRNG